MRMDELKLSSLFKDVLTEPEEPPTRLLLNRAMPYIHDSFEGETVLSVGKLIEHYHQNASGVANVMPFTCMPGNVVTALLRQIREDTDHMPVVSLAYDGQPAESTQTRIEAFMHQVREFHQKRRARRKETTV